VGLPDPLADLLTLAVPSHPEEPDCCNCSLLHNQCWLLNVIYGTQFRKPTIASVWHDELYAYIGGILRDNRGVLLKAGGVEDPIHLLAKLPPTIAVSDMLRLMKANSSKWINDVYQPKQPFEWQTGYAAFSVSESQTESVASYISSQREHPKSRTIQEEFLLMLKKNNIEFNPRYIFE